jgi:serine/threonine-protein kinase
MAMAHHALAHRDASAAALRSLANAYGDQMRTIARVHAFRAEPDQAFAWLERAYQAHDSDLVYLKPDPFLKPLHGDPRWGALLKRIGLPAD